MEILSEGGSAADGAIAACLASCVAETVMTGLLGGGHAIYFDAATGRARNLDCFVAVPGLGAERAGAELVQMDVPFGDELVRYSVGVASCAVPGVPSGLDELWRWSIQPDSVYEHRWRVGDVLIWSNYCTMHKREEFDGKSIRRMHRSQIKGTRAPEPYFA